MPDVDDETLEAYYEHLRKNLISPFTAEYREEYGQPQRVKIIGLGDPDDDPTIDEMDGILCEARLKEAGKKFNYWESKEEANRQNDFARAK